MAGKRKWKYAGRNPTTGKPYFRWEEVASTKPEDMLPPSIDEVPPAGVEGPLLKKPPLKMAGVTEEQVRKSAERGGESWIKDIADK